MAVDTPEHAAASLLYVGRSTIISVASSSSAQKADMTVATASAGGSTASSSVPRKRLGGLQEEVRQLKELIFLPLMRPELFQQHGESGSGPQGIMSAVLTVARIVRRPSTSSRRSPARPPGYRQDFSRPLHQLLLPTTFANFHNLWTRALLFVPRQDRSSDTKSVSRCPQERHERHHHR